MFRCVSRAFSSSVFPTRVVMDLPPRPANVGILAMDVYFPTTYVNQTELESFDGAGAGKYTAGLGQENMAFCGDREDTVSICLSAMHNLFSKYGISPKDIGRLDVGTESLLDKSKSIKTDLMRMFEDSGNLDVEGCDNINACYGGTAALLNAVSWVESSSWDGRYALVVCGDIAVYARGNARPTGGCCAAAILVGPDAPIVMLPGARASYMQHAYDFYKPDLSSEFPVVDGALSIICYYRAIDSCYQKIQQRLARALGIDRPLTLDDIDFLIFHSPFNKLVQKSFARCLYNDLLLQYNEKDKIASDVQEILNMPYEQTFGNRDFEKVMLPASKDLYDAKVVPGALLPKQLGNSYTCSLYSGLASLVGTHGDSLEGKLATLFSYGSGLCSTMFGVSFRSTTSPVFNLENMQHKIDVQARLASRTKVDPQEFTDILALREHSYGSRDFVPKDGIDQIPSGAFYLEEVDDKWRRKYSQKL